MTDDNDLEPEIAALVTKCSDLQSKLAQAEKERDEARDDYNTLVGLLKKRFPKLPNGNLPDFAVEDVLTENTRMREALEAYRTLRWYTPHPRDWLDGEMDSKDVAIYEKALAVVRSFNEALNPKGTATNE